MENPLCCNSCCCTPSWSWVVTEGCGMVGLYLYPQKRFQNVFGIAPLHGVCLLCGKSQCLITDILNDESWEAGICRVSHALELTPSVGKVFVMAAGFSCPLMTSPSINLTAPLDNPGSPWPGWPHHLVVTGCLWHKGSRTPQSDKEMPHV